MSVRSVDARIEQAWRAEGFRRAMARALVPAISVGSRAARRVLGRFEHSLGGKVEPDGSTVVVEDRIRTDALGELVRGASVCAIVVRQFCSGEVAERLSKLALSEYTNWRLNGNEVTDMFYAGGSIPQEVARRSRQDFQRYVAEWDDFVDRQRTAAGGAWPIDRLRLALDESWPAGALLGSAGPGVRSRPAIMRIMLPDAVPTPAGGYVHVDHSPFLSPERAVLSANVYLQMPPEGGELHVWNVNFSGAQGPRQRLRNGYLCTFGSDVFTLPVQEQLRRWLPPPLTIRPRTGDLVIIHSGRPHAVAPVEKGLRVTNQTFIHHQTRRPLAVFS